MNSMERARKLEHRVNLAPPRMRAASQGALLWVLLGENSGWHGDRSQMGVSESIFMRPEGAVC